MGDFGVVIINLGLEDGDYGGYEESDHARTKIRKWVHAWFREIYPGQILSLDEGYPADLNDVEGAFPGTGAVQASLLSWNAKFWGYDDLQELLVFLQGILTEPEACQVLCKLEDDTRFRVYIWESGKFVEAIDGGIN